ncbi:putative alpha-galactosidase B [Aspergillus campestris IBT 28561]|uniref:Alpha-galactosidase n=1 Tax=Aspergillus campestris (strain IBT 28561) TaxID=1392248 RepID=A0A2I1DFM9_ASPC2|nr:putative alpha-galactosidase B [Aspergillus campestris IBT 28561]PKY08682.1 putative alpha-galactosidase B [Aspergillus campestris IBT 28561]
MRDRALFLSALLAGLPHGTLALEMADGIGKLPALGWSTWNAFACEIDADKIMTAANQFVELGLKDLGYEYINIDDCYSEKNSRDSETNRIKPDLNKFPDGISGLAEQIHALGLKVGIYSSAGTETCAGYPASLGNEDIDAETFAEWGIDYLKYDNCGVPPDWADEYTHCVPDTWNGDSLYPNGTCPELLNPAPEGYDWNESNTAKRYRAMRDALLKVDRPILYALCEWGQADVNAWGNETAQSWRTTPDITDSWDRIIELANENSFYMEYVDFWGHPDPDMLEVGNGKLTLEENRAHFALWAAMKSPLIIGTSLDTIDPDHLAILKNEYLLAFNQDPVIGRPAYPYKWGYNEDHTFDPAHPAEYWSGPSSTLEGTLVLMFNSEGEKKTRTAVWSEIPELGGGEQRDDRHQSGRRWSRRGQNDRHQSDVKGKGFQVTDVWTGKDLGCIEDQYEVELESHDIAALVVGGAC